jgi:hypothetical protein
MQQLERMAQEDGGGPEKQSPADPAAVGIHPQIALWLVRGALGATIGITALALLPEGPTQTPMPQTAALSQTMRSEMSVLPMAAAIAPMAAAQTTAMPVSVKQQPPNGDSSDSATRPPVASNRQAAHRVDRSPPRQTKPKTYQSRNTARSHHTTKRPLAAVARGAKRTIRAVGRTIGRLL